MLNKLLPGNSNRRHLLKRWLFAPKVPPHISKKFISIPDSKLDMIGESLRCNFFSQSPNGWLSSELGKQDFQDHLLSRLEENRRYRIPWLDHANPLSGSRVLEIGCGTGASTVALAEQAAHVVAIDIDDLALLDARKRCEVYGLEVDFIKINATQVSDVLDGEKFDFIIFWACLEHLTVDERLSAIKSTYEMLAPGGLWCVTDSPNRLWVHDFHSSLLPFFMWLPDQLAIQYARFSPRQRFRDAFGGDECDDLNLRLARLGRGVSFHEFALSIDHPENLDVVSCMEIFNRHQRILSRLKWSLSSMRLIETILYKSAPSIHRGFFQQNLDLILRKH